MWLYQMPSGTLCIWFGPRGRGECPKDLRGWGGRERRDWGKREGIWVMKIHGYHRVVQGTSFYYTAWFIISKILMTIWHDVNTSAQHSGCLMYRNVDFSKFHICALMRSICFSLYYLLHSVWQTLGPSTSLQMTQLHSFLWQSSIPLHMWTTSSLSIHLSLDIRVVSTSWLS